MGLEARILALRLSMEFVAWSLDMSFKAGIRASRLKCGHKGWDLGFKVGIRVLRLGFGFQGGGGYEGSDDLCSRLKLELWFWSDMCLD